MKEELNIAAILMEKPTKEIKKMKFWSSIFGEVYLTKIDYLTGMSVLHHDCQSLIPANGKMWEDGECVFFPSNKMRDWEKFAWKKGDVLKSGVDNLCIFEEWDNDSYTKFNANFITDRYNGGVLETKDWSKETDENIIKQYIAKIEEIKGGKLNLSTLEIQKHPEFKDGDILYDGDNNHYLRDCVFIAKYDKNGQLSSECALIEGEGLCFGCEAHRLYEHTRPATDTEKQQLFDALSKEGKRWNPETLQVEDLPKKCEFKTMDYVLVKAREDKYALWDLYQFAHKGINIFNMVGGINFAIADYKVLPYNDQTAHLLGTTDEWKH